MQRIHAAWLSLVIALLACSLRMPQILNSERPLDGDESVVATMALHDSRGMDVPIYFYGQAYGFTWPEYKIISLAYSWFGVSIENTRWAMLFLFGLGVWIFCLFLFKRFGKEQGLWLALLFALCPAWGVWAIKARGGYLTALLFTSIFLLTFESGKNRLNIPAAIILGLCLSMIYESHFLFLAIPIALMARHFMDFRKITIPAVIGIVAILGVLAFIPFQPDVIQHEGRTVVVEPITWLKNGAKIIPTVAGMFENTFILTDYKTMGLYGRLIGYLWTLPVLGMIFFFVKNLKHPKWKSAIFWLVGALIMLLFINIFSKRIAFRYYLGVSMILVIVLGHLNWLKHKHAKPIVIAFLILNAIYLPTLQNFTHTQYYTHSLDQGMKVIREEGNRNIVLDHEMFSWELQFHSGDEYNITNLIRPRYEPYRTAVEDELQAGGTVTRLSTRVITMEPPTIEFYALPDTSLVPGNLAEK